MGKLDDETRSVFADVYRFMEKYWDMDNTLQGWASASQEMQEIWQKHNEDLFVMSLLIACYCELERRALCGEA